MYRGGKMKKITDKAKPKVKKKFVETEFGNVPVSTKTKAKPKELDEWTKYMNHINDLLKVKKDNRSLEILMECLRKMENRDK